MFGRSGEDGIGSKEFRSDSEPPKLVEYVYRRTGKVAVLVKQEVETPKIDEDEKAKEDSKDEKKSEASGGKWK
ncbi:hypothetical protein V6N13_035859 [Hibiscus sabdariffa]